MRRLAARENGPMHKALALSLSHANACNPLLQAHPSALGAGQHKGRGFPLLFSPLCVPSRADPSGLGHAATIYSSVQGPPGVETPTVTLSLIQNFFESKLFSKKNLAIIPSFQKFFPPFLLSEVRWRSVAKLAFARMKMVSPSC
jgi:hypothetical protein